MSGDKHSPEPWRVGNRDGDPSFPDEIDDASGFRCAAAYGHGNSRHPDETAEANARRIVAAVNAVAGIPTEALEAGALAVAIEALEHIGARDGLFEANDAAFAPMVVRRVQEQARVALRALGRTE